VTERQALVVRGGWEGHQPVEATDYFIPHLEASGFAVRVEDSPKVYAEADYMAGVDLIMQCMTMSTIEKDELAGLTSAVANGTGLAGWHGGIADSYRNSSDYLQLIGGQFACHPPKAPGERKGEQADYFIPYRVEITGDHPITQGIGDFDLVTEQYWVLSDEYNHVLATTTLAMI
jgi:type 1 glutamine amidotransferase